MSKKASKGQTEKLGRSGQGDESASSRLVGGGDKSADNRAGWLEGLVGRGDLTEEEADRMVTQALDCDLDEPEPFVKVLLFLHDLHDQGREAEFEDSLHRLMEAAYNNSVVHSGNFYEYLDSIRQGRSLVKRARARIAKG